MAPRTTTPKPVPPPAPESALTSSDDASAALSAWANGVVPKALVNFGPFPTETTSPSIHFLLADLEPVRSPRGLRGEPPRRAVLTYLVTVWSADSQEVARLTSELLFAAMEQPRFNAVSSGAALWQSLRIAPHPSITICLTIERARVVAPSAPAVGSVHIEASPTRILHGAVRGPGKIPIADALVELPALNLYSRTNHRGHFTLGAVTVSPGLLTIRLTAKGTQREFQAKIPSPPDLLVLDLADFNL